MRYSCANSKITFKSKSFLFITSKMDDKMLLRFKSNIFTNLENVRLGIVIFLVIQTGSSVEFIGIGSRAALRPVKSLC